MVDNNEIMEIDGILYRAANADDYSQVKEVVSELFDIKVSMDNYKDYIEQKEVDVIVAEDLQYDSTNGLKDTIDNKLIGRYLCGLLCIERQWIAFSNFTNFYIRNAGVRSRYRRKGIYGNLMKIVEQKAKFEHIHAIELTCSLNRSEAHRFYLNNGFNIKKTLVFINEVGS